MRKNTRFKLIITPVLLLFFTACQTSVLNKDSQLNSAVNLVDAPLSIDILETGKSDCIVIQARDKVVMIDTGLNANGKQIVKFLEEEQIDTIDYLIISHLDKDHIGGADIVLDAVTVNHVIQPDYVRDTKQHAQYIEALEEHNITPIYLTSDMTFQLDGITLDLFAPLENEYEQSNNYSIIASITFGEHQFLFAGDAEEARLDEFLASNPQQYTLLKVPHHGKYNGKLDELLTETTPAYAIITCSEEEYADMKVLEILENHQVQTLLTTDGPIQIQSDGTNISVHQQLKTAIPTS